MTLVKNTKKRKIIEMINCQYIVQKDDMIPDYYVSSVIYCALQQIPLLPTT